MQGFDNFMGNLMGSLPNGLVPGAAGSVAKPAVSQSVTVVVDTLFGKFDADKSAGITAAEIKAVIDPKGVATGLDAALAAMISSIDSNHDGALSKAEVTAAVSPLDTDGDGLLGPARMLGAIGNLLGGLLRAPGHIDTLPPAPPTLPVPPTAAELVDDVFGRFDTNSNGSITLAELLAVLDPKSLHTRLDDALKQLVTVVDTDKDGAMSKAEVLAAVKSLDANGDGFFSHADHIPGPPADDSIDLIGVLLPRLCDFQGDGPGHGG